MLRRWGLPIETDLHEHLVTDAVTDTALGDIERNPEQERAVDQYKKRLAGKKGGPTFVNIPFKTRGATPGGRIT